MLRDPRLSFSSALRELEFVHRCDQARLLREACALACAGSGLARLYVAGFEHAPAGSSPELARSNWDRACLEEIEVARKDEFRPDPMLPALLELPTSLWPCATDLARAALELKPSHGGRVDLARAMIAEADPTGAIGELRRLLDEDPTPAVRGAALEALALAFECDGDPRASLSCYEAAARQIRSDPRVAVALLALALRVGDRSAVSLAAQRLAPLDLSVAGTRRRFDRALRAARGRARRRGRVALRRSEDESQWQILEMALSGSEACSEIARTLIGSGG